LVILHLMHLWSPYLLGHYFQIKMDHQNLKYFLEQWISSLEKRKWLTKLFQGNMKGKENVVSNALSRKYEEEVSLCSLSLVFIDWLQDVC